MSTPWNMGFDKIVKDGDAGNQAQLGIFYDTDRGTIKRMGEAEGHELAFNPETVERNLIWQEAPSDEVRSYRYTFDKEFLIKKGGYNYEDFDKFRKGRFTGDNAKMRVYIVDFRQEEAGSPHYNYYTEVMTVTVTVETANETDGTLSVSFSQAGDTGIGVMTRTDNSTSEDWTIYTYGFTPSQQIPVTTINSSLGNDTTVFLHSGEEKWVEIELKPLGCPIDFEYKSDDEGVCIVTRTRQSAVIKARGSGDATVTITAGTITKEIEVSVT